LWQVLRHNVVKPARLMKADDKLKKQKTSDTKEETMIAMRR